MPNKIQKKGGKKIPAKIFIYDEFAPQDNAMLQALYSRSPLSVTKHVAKVRKAGSGKFMERFYVGYGHAYIADCGSTTIFIEGLSILADKAVQDWPLYSGQETSTRYVDMSKQAIIDPIDTPASRKIINDWMDFYLGSQDPVRQFRARNIQKSRMKMKVCMRKPSKPGLLTFCADFCRLE